MRSLIFAAILPFLTAPAFAQAPCPVSENGAPYPWWIEERMSGDRYAEVFIEVDRAGKPLDCKLGKNNIGGDDKWFVCQAFLAQWATAAPASVDANGRAVIKRQYMEYGFRHLQAERAAKRKYFAENPTVSPACWPDEEVGR